MSTLASSNQSSTRFFSALRHLARDVDDGMRKLQQRLQPEGQSTTDGQGQHVTAMKLTLEWKKELEALMKSGREVLRDMRDRSKHFEQNLQIIQELMDVQQTQTAQIQSYLQQYGYLLPTEETSSCTEGSDTNAEKTELNQDNPTEKAPPQSSEMSPRLEDFGISSYTLSMLSHPNVAKLQQDVKVSTGFSQRSQNEGASVKHDSVPTPFQNKGLMVTPSLFPDCHNSIYGRSEDLTCSPACTVFTKNGQTPLWRQVQELKHSLDKKKLAKALEFSDSPVPPVLHTPGIKQIPSMKEFMSESKVKQKINADSRSVQEECLSPVPPVLMTPGIEQIPSIKETAEQQKASSSSHRSKVVRQLRLENELFSDVGPPVLHTLGIKHITQGNSKETVTSSIRYLTSKVSTIYEDDLEMPESPQVTYSLKDLEEMAMNFRNTSLTDAFTHTSFMVDDGKRHLTDYKSLPSYEKSCKTEAPERQSNLILPSSPDLQSSSFISEPPLEPLFAQSVIDRNDLPPVPEFRSFRVNGSQLEHHFTGLLSTNSETYKHDHKNSKRHLQEEKMAIMTDDLPVDATVASTQKCDQKKCGPRSDADRSRFGFRSDCGKMLTQTGCQSYDVQKESRRRDAAAYIKLKEEGVIFQSVRKTSHSKLASGENNKENLENLYSLPHKPLFGAERSTMLTTVQKTIWQ